MKRLSYSIGVLLLGAWLAPLHAQQPSGSILGHVTNAVSQRPIQGVSLSIAGRSAVTRADGSYLINGVPAGSDSLHARMIGYEPQAQLVERPRDSH